MNFLTTTTFELQGTALECSAIPAYLPELAHIQYNSFVSFPFSLLPSPSLIFSFFVEKKNEIPWVTLLSQFSADTARMARLKPHTLCMGMIT